MTAGVPRVLSVSPSAYMPAGAHEETRTPWACARRHKSSATLVSGPAGGSTRRIPGQGFVDRLGRPLETGVGQKPSRPVPGVEAHPVAPSVCPVGHLRDVGDADLYRCWVREN